ncbi:MAG: PAS domain-containing protein [Chloroflexi bacterium]|nr:PAS domain-containing protein [Chloroflexota bacterium]
METGLRFAAIQNFQQHLLLIAGSLTVLFLILGWLIAGRLADSFSANAHPAPQQQTKRDGIILMSNLPGMAYRRRPDDFHIFTFVSEGCFTLTGYTREVLLAGGAIHYANLIHPDDREAAFAEIERGSAKQDGRINVPTASSPLAAVNAGCGNKGKPFWPPMARCKPWKGLSPTTPAKSSFVRNWNSAWPTGRANCLSSMMSCV